MDERVVQFRVGVTVIAAIIVMAILVLLFNGVPVLTENVRVYIALPSAPGVSRDTPVQKSGVLVGRVTSVEIVEDGGVLVTAELKAAPWLTSDQVAEVRAGILGDSVIELIRHTTNMPPKPIENGSRLAGVVQGDPIAAFSNIQGDLSNAIQSFGTTSDEIRVLVTRFNDLLQANDSQLTRIIDNTEEAVSKFSQTADSINQIVSDPSVRDALVQAVERLPQTIEDVRMTMNGLQNTLSLADQNLRNFEGLTAPLGERGPQIIANVEDATRNLDVVVNQFASFMEAVNRPDGSLGQLLNDPALYQQVTSTIANVNQITCRLQPIVEDVRVITDRVARHPGVILRDAVSPLSGIK